MSEESCPADKWNVHWGRHSAQRYGSEFHFQSYQTIIDLSCHRFRKGHPGRMFRVRRNKGSEREGKKKREEPKKKAETMPLISQTWRKLNWTPQKHPLCVKI